MDISDFLCDLFCVGDLCEVKNLDLLFNIKDSCLEYKALFAHPRLKTSLMFISLFRETFGFYPSHPFVVALTKGMHEWDHQEVVSRMQSNTFLKYTPPHSPLQIAFERAKSNTQNTMFLTLTSHNEIKKLIWGWLSRDTPCVLPEGHSLFSAFKELLNPRRHGKIVNVSTVSDLFDMPLDYTEMMALCPYNYDVRAHHITLNMNYYRQIYGKVLVYIDSNINVNTAVKFITTVADGYPKERIVVGIADAKQAATFDSMLNHNVAYVTHEFIPCSCANLCFHLMKTIDTQPLKLGSTSIYRVLLTRTPISLKLCNKTIIAITDGLQSRDIVKLSLPTVCIPLYLPQVFASAYFKMYVEALQQGDNTSLQARNALYSVLIPSLTTLKFDLSGTLCLPKVKTGRKNALLLIDTRANPLSVVSLIASWANLISGIPPSCIDFEIVIGTTKSNQTYYKNIIPNARFVEHSLLEKSPFDIDAYNILLKSPSIWKSLLDMGYNKCIIVQDDGVLARPGLPNSIFMNNNFTYVGAPWLPCAANEEVSKLTSQNMVGNGGFCIRNIGEMYDIAKTHNEHGRTLFNGRLQPIQEDVFYSRFASKTPNLQEASFFSMEQVFNTKALGFHKPWAYHSIDKIIDLAKDILTI